MKKGKQPNVTVLSHCISLQTDSLQRRDWNSSFIVQAKLVFEVVNDDAQIMSI